MAQKTEKDSRSVRERIDHNDDLIDALCILEAVRRGLAVTAEAESTALDVVRLHLAALEVWVDDGHDEIPF